MTNENEYIHRFVDEAEVKRAETERIIQLKKMEAVEKEHDDLARIKKTKEKMTIAFGALAVIFIGVGATTPGQRLEDELNSRLTLAGIEVVEARINYLAYASEIAGVMLRRQQADAIIAARERIVEGAVSMVHLALEKLEKDSIVELDEEKKATMVSNLLVVLCADESAQPVINTGTLYQ